MRISSLPTYLYKASMPNLCQTDKRARVLREDGLSLCGPVTVSNILIYLAKTHFPPIVPEFGNLSEFDVQLNLIEKLAKYMKTDTDGTNDADLIEGLTKYIREHGYKTEVFQEGFEGQENFTPDVIGDPAKIMPFAIGTSNAILSVNFCKVDPETKRYEPIDEWHYVNLAGFSNCRVPKLIVHDPSPATEREPKECELFKIEDGTLHNWYPPNEFDAKGFLELEGIGIHEEDKKKGASKIVLDSILAFKVEQK
ncbi:MAG: hypothetical protein HYZ79_09480 [Candidatus Melainabacteria bacterium]|nr:hypothetical protein [Candidatus Melainabacteria bacterium]